MPMNPPKLAKEMQDAIGQSGKPTSKENEGLAKAIIGEIKELAIVNFLPGTVQGTTAAGGPLSAGSASNGVIIGPTPVTLAARIAKESGFPGPTPQLLGMATGVVTHLLTGTVSFSPGGITGQCTSSTNSPGPLIGAGANGKIVGLQGPAMADLVSKGMGQPSASPELAKLCGAIVDHIMQNAAVSFPMASVVGTCPPGGGPLALGAATGGKVA